MEFEALFNAYFNDVYRYIRRLSNDAHIAEEVTSETFFRALRSVDGFRGECDLRVWLCQIAKNCYYSYLKKSGQSLNIDDTLVQAIPDSGGTLEELMADREQAAQLRNLLHAIPEPYKEVFMWRVFADLSFKQIGQIFHKSDNWACVTYHRARNMLRARLEEKEHEK